ncbi:GNAT family N-acetyltransferase [Streptococcus pluranimalium]|uniref:GNAT family N-acetyltransferase n=1 Tax=Streptococcus pluranimalium TaxID=82348 RepID=UPI001C4C1585|nr:GNAT family N-acetyltransferase [Streptococcus pluranimalium]WFM80460.1 GNAT family N-acetyltransferase [Streptococcus pluranimalium]
MVTISFKADENRSIALDKNTEIGECTYQTSDGIWIINHTFVEPEYGGQGIAKQLVEKIIWQAREANTKVSSTCSYAINLFNKTDDYNDVLIDD